FENRNFVLEYRWDAQNARMAELAADLVRRQASIILSLGGVPSALATKAATATIPIVFQVGVDPVELGLVSSLNRPGGNLTGVSSLNTELAPKRLELLHELMPAARVIALLVNPSNQNAEVLARDAAAAARALGLELHVLKATHE